MSTPDASGFPAALEAIVGAKHILIDEDATRPYRIGFRCGGGEALVVVRPGSLVQMWRVLQACVATNKIVIVQAANTGLTGGSTPAGDYDRDVVIVSTLRIAKLFVIDGGHQVICLPGTTLYQLEEALEPFGREPHSVIGSSCIGASVMGGICNNSGGALLRRGPAYTEWALFARLSEPGHLQLVNHLGVRLGEEPEEILNRLEQGRFSPADIEHDASRQGSDRGYARRVRAIDSQSPARFNADPQRLFEASGSAGRIALLAVRLDTFPKDEQTRVFYVGTRDPGELTALRREVLGRFVHLPVAGEYLHRDMFDVAQVYGKDSFLMIQWLGAKRLPKLFAAKRAFDAFGARWGLGWLGSSDVWLQRLSRMFPSHVPARMRTFRERFEHHLILKTAGDGIGEARDYLESVFPSASGDFFECTPPEAGKAFLHRFVAAGAAIRYRAVHAREVGEIVALDVALRQNDREWFEVLPEEAREGVHLALHYGHFFCHVFHRDYIARRGSDALALEHRLLELLDERGAEYPAEHNVGHLYPAKPALAAFYRALDPCNAFNPGIGKTSRFANWARTASAIAFPAARKRFSDAAPP
jgi:D-lactate dehydrogenase